MNNRTPDELDRAACEAEDQAALERRRILTSPPRASARKPSPPSLNDSDRADGVYQNERQNLDRLVAGLAADYGAKVGPLRDALIDTIRAAWRAAELAEATRDQRAEWERAHQ